MLPEDPISSFALEIPKRVVGFGVFVGVQEGDFEVVYQTYHFRIYTYIVRMVGDKEIGQDLTQDTFISAWRNLGKLKKISSLESWLYTIATNKVRDHIRKKRGINWLPWIEKQEDAYVAEQLQSIGPEEYIPEAELVQQILAQLSFEEKACLLLSHVEEFSQREIAEALHISERGIRRHLTRATEKFETMYRSAHRQDKCEDER